MIWYINPRRKTKRKAPRRRAAPRSTFGTRAMSAARFAAPHVRAAAAWAGRSAVSGARKLRESYGRSSARRRVMSAYSRRNPSLHQRYRSAGRFVKVSVPSRRKKRKQLAGAALAAWRKKRGLPKVVYGSATSNPSRRKKTMAKSRKRSAAARKAAKTRALKKLARSRAAKKGARRRRSRSFGRSLRGFSRRRVLSMYGKRPRRRSRKSVRADIMGAYKPNPRRRRRRRMRRNFNYLGHMFSNPKRKRRRRRRNPFGMVSNPRKRIRRGRPRRRSRRRRNPWFGQRKRHARAAKKGWARRRRRQSAGRRLRKGSRSAARYLARGRYRTRKNAGLGRVKGVFGTMWRAVKAAAPVVVSWSVSKMGARLMAGLPLVNSLGMHSGPAGAALMYFAGGVARRSRFVPNIAKKWALNEVGLGIMLFETLARTYLPGSIKGFLGLGEYFETQGEYFETQGEYFETGAVADLAATEDLAMGAYYDSMAPGMDQMVPYQPMSAQVPSRALAAPVEEVDQAMLNPASYYTGIFAGGDKSPWDF